MNKTYIFNDKNDKFMAVDAQKLYSERRSLRVANKATVQKKKKTTEKKSTSKY